MCCVFGIGVVVYPGRVTGLHRHRRLSLRNRSQLGNYRKNTVEVDRSVRSVSANEKRITGAGLSTVPSLVIVGKSASGSPCNLERGKKNVGHIKTPAPGRPRRGFAVVTTGAVQTTCSFQYDLTAPPPPRNRTVYFSSSPVIVSGRFARFRSSSEKYCARCSKVRVFSPR